ncbi:MAG: beta-propeller fold lactonase family protein [Bacillota bacterium]
MKIFATNFLDKGEAAYFEEGKKVWSMPLTCPKCTCTDGKYCYTYSLENGVFEIHSFEMSGNGFKVKSKLVIDEVNIAHMNYSKVHNLLFLSSTESGFTTAVNVEDGELMGVAFHLMPGGVAPSGCHQVIFNKAEDLAVAVNISQNKVFFYNFADKAFEEKAVMSFPDGTKPRHAMFAPDEKVMYLVTEGSNELFVIDYKNLKVLQTNKIVDIEAEDAKVATMAIDPNKNLLFATIRGNNQVAEFAMGEDGLLTRKEIFSTHGDRSPNMIISNDKKFLVFGNLFSNNITIVDAKTKELVLAIPFEKALGIAEVL